MAFVEALKKRGALVSNHSVSWYPKSSHVLRHWLQAHQLLHFTTTPVKAHPEHLGGEESEIGLPEEEHTLEDWFRELEEPLKPGEEHI